jgi:hypothetical protein
MATLGAQRPMGVAAGAFLPDVRPKQHAGADGGGEVLGN